MIGRSEGSAGLGASPGARVTSMGTSFSGGSRMFASFLSCLPASAVAIAANTEYWRPHWWPFNYAPSQIGIEITVGGVAALGRIAVYEMLADMSIGNRLGLAADLDFSAAAVRIGAIAPTSWPGPGLYWTAIDISVGATVRYAANAVSAMPIKSAGSFGAFFTRAGTYATSLPTTGPALSALTGGGPGADLAILLGAS